MSGIGYTKTVIFWRPFASQEGQNLARIRAFEPASDCSLITDPSWPPHRLARFSLTDWLEEVS